MRHIIRYLVLVLLLAAFLPSAQGMAADTDVGGLTMKELNDWVGQMLVLAKDGSLTADKGQAEWTDDGYEVKRDFGAMYLDTKELNDDSVINAIAVTQMDVACPRDIYVSDTQQMLLSAYANENLSLVGSRDFAVLYLSNNLPEEVLWARVQRDGQQIQTVQYAVHQRLENGQYTDCGLIYSLENGAVTAVRAYGLNAAINLDQVNQIMAEMENIQKDDSYFAYPQSSQGTDLEPFGREDLMFSGLDFLDLTPEGTIDTLGPYEAETWMEDDTGEWLRILQWPGVEITFAYTADKVFVRVDTLDLTQRGVEGPRAVMVGDTLSSVMMRFRHSEGEYNGTNQEVLYGDGQTPPYGLAEYSDATATLHYAFAAESGGQTKTVTLQMIFVDTQLSELFLYSW